MAMSSLTVWMKLTRPEQRVVIKLFGGGSLRGVPVETIEVLRGCDLIDDDGLTVNGLEAFKAAHRVQQAIRLAA
jgi:hypothetical protein